MAKINEELREHLGREMSKPLTDRDEASKYYVAPVQKRGESEEAYFTRCAEYDEWFEKNWRTLKNKEELFG
jgi:hypothetical protein